MKKTIAIYRMLVEIMYNIKLKQGNIVNDVKINRIN